MSWEIGKIKKWQKINKERNISRKNYAKLTKFLPKRIQKKWVLSFIVPIEHIHSLILNELNIMEKVVLWYPPPTFPGCRVASLLVRPVQVNPLYRGAKPCKSPPNDKFMLIVAIYSDFLTVMIDLLLCSLHPCQGWRELGLTYIGMPILIYAFDITIPLAM